MGKRHEGVQGTDREDALSHLWLVGSRQPVHHSQDLTQSIWIDKTIKKKCVVLIYPPHYYRNDFDSAKKNEQPYSTYNILFFFVIWKQARTNPGYVESKLKYPSLNLKKKSP